MCKRFYVEVTGLGEDGEAELQKAGINKDAILVVDEEVRNRELVEAIREVTGIGFDDIKSSGSTRYIVMARCMYIHFAIEMGDSIGRICKDIGRDERRLRWYKNEYENKMAGDIEFRKDVNRLLELIEIAPVKERLSPSKKIGRRKKRRRLRKVSPSSEKNIRQIIDKRQLTINFNY